MPQTVRLTSSHLGILHLAFSIKKIGYHYASDAPQPHWILLLLCSVDHERKDESATAITTVCQHIISILIFSSVHTEEELYLGKG